MQATAWGKMTAEVPELTPPVGLLGLNSKWKPMFSGVLPTQPWWEATPLCSAPAPYFKILLGRLFLTLIGLDLRERIELGRGEAGGRWKSMSVETMALLESPWDLGPRGRY